MTMIWRYGLKMSNKIRMRVNKDPQSICKVCRTSREKSVEMFDIAFTDKHIITICDKCNNDLFKKVLKADCSVNAKLKTKKDLAIISKRHKV